MLQRNEVTQGPKAGKGRVVAVLGLLAVLGLGSYLVFFNAEKPWQPDKSQIKVGTVSKESITGDIPVSGVIDADNKSSITTQIPGNVAQVMVKEGSVVKKGDPLFSLDKKDLQVQLNQAQLNVQRSLAAVEQAKLALDNAQAEYNRNQQLYNAGAIPKKQFEQITMARDVAQSQYDTARTVGVDSANQAVQAVQLNLAKTAVLSPIDGTVAALNVSAGDNVNPGVPLITLVSSQALSINSTVSEALVDNLQQGLEAQVEVDSLAQSKFSAVTTFISPVSIQTGQFFPVKLTVSNNDGRLRPGMTARALIHVRSKESLVVPNSAIFRRDGRNYVYQLKDGKAVKTAVTTGLKGENSTVVLSGLNFGDKLVVQGTDLIEEGMQLASAG